MKILLFVFLLANLNLVFAKEGFLKARVLSRRFSDAILVKCAIREDNQGKSCAGYQFYYSEDGSEAKAKLLNEQVFTDFDLKESRQKFYLSNELIQIDGASNSVMLRSLEFLNDYSEDVKRSRVGDVLYYIGRGLSYTVVVPLTFAGDVIGFTIGAPKSLVVNTKNKLNNSKIDKLIEAIRMDKEVKLNFNRFESLVDGIKMSGSRDGQIVFEE